MIGTIEQMMWTALQNVQKYASAGTAAIRLHEGDGKVTFEVTDDSVGFDIDSVARGTGLQNMHDRLEALGPAVSRHSRPGATVVGGTVPTPVAERVAAVA